MQVGGPAMARALEIFKELLRFNVPVNNQACTPLLDHTFNGRKCMITLRWSDVLKVGYSLRLMMICMCVSGN